MGNAGSPYPRFQRALKTGDLGIIQAAALECQRIDLGDALTMVVLYREKAPQRFERACLKWLARFAVEKAHTVEDVSMAVDALAIMPVEPEQALERLQRLCA